MPRGPLRNEAEKQLGFIIGEHSLILKYYINMISQIMFDWMHMYLVGGLADNEFGWLMCALRAAGAPTTYAVLGKLVEMFTWPKQISKPSSRRLFGAKAAGNNLRNRHFSASASELLSLMPVLGYYFARAAVQAPCNAEVQSFMALVDAIEILQCVKEGVVTPAVVHEAITNHLDKRATAYDVDHEAVMKPHYVRHLARQFQRHSALYACFTPERLHALAIKYAATRRNTKSYERGVMEEVTIEQYMRLKEHWMLFGMKLPIQPKARIAAALGELTGAEPAQHEISHAVRLASGTVTVGDVVFFHQIDGTLRVGEICVFFCHGGGPAHAVIVVWAAVEAAVPVRHARHYRGSGVAEIIDIGRIARAAVYSGNPRDEQELKVVLLPPPYRSP